MTHRSMQLCINGVHIVDRDVDAPGRRHAVGCGRHGHDAAHCLPPHCDSMLSRAREDRSDKIWMNETIWQVIFAR